MRRANVLSWGGTAKIGGVSRVHLNLQGDLGLTPSQGFSRVKQKTLIEEQSMPCDSRLYSRSREQEVR